MTRQDEVIAVPWRQRSLRVEVSRRGEKAPWVLALHGLQSGRTVFEGLFAHPGLGSLSIVAPDLVGFGDSEAPDDFSYDLADQAELLLALLDRLGIARASVVGHSLGGMIGTLLLRLAPARIDGLVSLEGNLAEADCGDSLRITALPYDRFAKAYRGSRPRAMYETAKAIVRWSRSEELFRIFESSSHPKLLVLGAKGKFRSRPAGARLAIVPDAGHFMLVDNPDGTLAAVAEFFSKPKTKS